jgi:hypothetical protein
VLQEEPPEALGEEKVDISFLVSFEPHLGQIISFFP